MKLIKYCLVGFLFSATSVSAFAQAGFVSLPKAGNAESAYVQCNPTGELGITNAVAPKDASNDTCSVTSTALKSNVTSAPIEGFRLIGVMVSDIPMPAPYSGGDAIAILSEAIWRNKDNTECILGTHLQMKDAPLIDGQYWAVNDIARAGFAGNDVAIAYFYKPHSAEVGGNTEVLFRAGRAFTSVSSSADALPTTKNAPPATAPISSTNAAAISDNWINFTTDVSFKDTDASTRAITSMFYIKYSCDARDPVSKPNAIRLRNTMQNGQKPFEIAVPGLVPVDAEIELY